MRWVIGIWVALLLLPMTVRVAALGDDSKGATSRVGAMLGEFAVAYSEVAPSGVSFSVQIDVVPPGESWQVSVGADGSVELLKGTSEAPALVIMLAEDTLTRIYQGRLTAFTAGAKASGDDQAPLELEFKASAQLLTDPKGILLDFIQHFFVRSRPERIVLREDHSRVVHGANAIPLYYASGFRSAWYKVNDGQHLNEPGDTNPFPQAFVIISGRGRAKIADDEIDVRAGESYFIPAGCDHVLWPARGDSLEVIWFAWGAGA
jgi:mannose-6-phosphate isomerase-like protein (cupin superfamily)